MPLPLLWGSLVVLWGLFLRLGDLETGRLEDLETWRLGDLATWRLGDLESWRPGDLKTWRLGDLETWRLGDLETGVDLWGFAGGPLGSLKLTCGV